MGDPKASNSSKPPVSGRVLRDTRGDNEPPSALEETPFARRATRSVPDGMAVRISSLEGEVERLVAQHARDADHLADLLLNVLDEKRLRGEAEGRVLQLGHALRSVQE